MINNSFTQIIRIKTSLSNQEKPDKTKPITIEAMIIYSNNHLSK